MGVFKIDYTKKPDDQFDYWRFWVNLEGKQIYAKRRKKISKTSYQSHHEIALDILNQNRKMYELWNELCKVSEFSKWVTQAKSFLIFYGFILVDANDGSENNIMFNSITTPKKLLDEMKQDKTWINFYEYDLAEEKATYTHEECQALNRLHKRILEARSKLEQGNTTTDHEKDDNER